MPTKNKHPEDYVKNFEQAKSLQLHELKIFMAKAVFSLLILSFIGFNLVTLFLMYKNNTTPDASKYVELFKSFSEVFKIAIGVS